MLRAEEALRVHPGDLVQRQTTGTTVTTVQRPRLLHHQVQIRPGGEQSPPAADPLMVEAGAEHSGGCSGGGCRVTEGVRREPERPGPDRLLTGPGTWSGTGASTRVAARLLPDQRLDAEAFLVVAVMEHVEHLELQEEDDEDSPGPL